MESFQKVNDPWWKGGYMTRCRCIGRCKCSSDDSDEIPEYDSDDDDDG